MQRLHIMCSSWCQISQSVLTILLASWSPQFSEYCLFLNETSLWLVQLSGIHLFPRLNGHDVPCPPHVLWTPCLPHLSRFPSSITFHSRQPEQVSPGKQVLLLHLVSKSGHPWRFSSQTYSLKTVTQPWLPISIARTLSSKSGGSTNGMITVDPSCYGFNVCHHPHSSRNETVIIGEGSIFKDWPLSS